MRIIITGGNGGVGRATAAALAAAGHSVVIACRNIVKAQLAAAEMSGDVDVRQLDLGDLASVRAFADSTPSVDVLINNAGVFGLPLTRTADGFEAHMGTNHLGHFALTCLLGDKITDRIVTVGSATYVFGRIQFDDLNWCTRDYSMWSAYAQSRLANMLFVNELARRGARAYLADPGAADTEIIGESAGLRHWLGEHEAVKFHLKTPPDASRATIEAVTTDLPSGSHLAPRSNQRPVATALRRHARDPVAAGRLWDLSADLTGCDWRSDTTHPLLW